MQIETTLPDLLTSLDRKETSVQAFVMNERARNALELFGITGRARAEWPTITAEHFRAWALTSFHPWEQRLANAVRFASIHPDSTAAGRMLLCSSRFRVVRLAHSAKHFVCAERCKGRWCVECAGRKNRTVWRNIFGAVAGREIRLVTLTQRATPEPLGASLDRLQGAWRKMLRQPGMLKAMGTSIATTEITRNDDRGWWHVHKHCLVSGSWVDRSMLADAWHRATGEKCHLDIRAVADNLKATRYVCKYIGKPYGSLHQCARECVADLVAGLAGRRMFSTTGKFVGVRLARAATAEMSESAWPTSADFFDSITRGDSDALKVAWEIVGNPAANAAINDNGRPCDADLE